MKVFLSSISCSPQHKPQEGNFQAPLGADKHTPFLFQVDFVLDVVTEEQAQSQGGNELTLPYRAASREGR